MGLLTKQYLRYIPGSVFGIIGTGRCIHYITKLNQKGKYVIVSACEFVYLWDLRRKVKVLTLHCEDIHGIVNVIEPRPPFKGSINNTHIAVGYSDGTVVLYDLIAGQPLKFNGHRGAVKTLAWDSQGMRVASGSTDGEIVIWDIVSERGIVRLRGHKGVINKVCFLQTRNVLISHASDKFFKFWDLDTNFCFYTLAKQSNEVLDFIVINNDTQLLAGERESYTVWGLEFTNHVKDEKLLENSDPNESEEPNSKQLILESEGEENEDHSNTEDVQEENPYMSVKHLGRIFRSKADRFIGFATDGRSVVAFGKSSVIDIYVILTEEELAIKRMNRLKRTRKRARELNVEAVNEDKSYLLEGIRRLIPFKALNTVTGISLTTMPDGVIKITTLNADNSLALYESHVNACRKNKEGMESKYGLSLHLSAHRYEIRSVAFNSVGDQIITSSAESIKVWDRQSTQSIKTIDCDYPLNVVVPPGDRHVVVGTKSGNLQLFDIISGTMLENLEAHCVHTESKDNGVWALTLTYDGRGIVSGGSDCMVKFWNFELVEDTLTGKGKRLSIVQDTRALKIADQPTSIRCSSSGKYLAVATFDLKETVYYADSLKLVHEFYGKSMPSTCLDFSSDNTLIVTGCKDSCIRIFATDFGDQKKLLKNCHQEGVTDVKFLANTHMFFSCGNDGTVKQWDADNFQRIVTLEGHFGIVRCLTLTSNGAFVVSCGQDRSIRIWNKTNEPLVLEDEREEEERKRQEEELSGATFQAPVLPGEKDNVAIRPSKISRETEKAADQLFEALSIYRQQKEEGVKPLPNQLMSLVYKTDDPLKFVLLVLRKIKSSELEESILVLPLNMILVLLVCVKGFLTRDWDVELSSRILVVAVRTNLPQLLASKEVATVIRAIATMLPNKVQIFQDMVGFNAAGLRHMVNRMEQRSENQLFVQAALKAKDVRRRGIKKQRIVKRALLSL